MLEGFDTQRIDAGEVEIHVAVAGDGPPLLLLHGYPQTHVMWHGVAPSLAERFTVVCPDLRGYGASSKPPSDPDHLTYSKRSSARDQVAVMQALGFERFSVAGHDRGGRVAHRLALDHPERVERLAVLDIVPTRHVFETADQHVAMATYHWFFLAQPFDLPERLIAADPAFFVRWHLRSWSGGADGFFADEAVDAYVAAFTEPATIHATCEDYRAGATIDLAHDETDVATLVECPLLALWGGRTRPIDILPIWRERARNVEGRALEAGHFLVEEQPEATAAELLRFFA